MRRFVLGLGLLLSVALPSRADDAKAPPKAPPAYFKVEVRGTLRVVEKVELVSDTLRKGLAGQLVNATVTTPGVVLYLAFGDNKELATLAKKLDGKAVLIRGELRRAYEGPISGLYPPRFDDYVYVTALKAAE
jgi:hypothetical protein